MKTNQLSPPPLSVDKPSIDDDVTSEEDNLSDIVIATEGNPQSLETPAIVIAEETSSKHSSYERHKRYLHHKDVLLYITGELRSGVMTNAKRNLKWANTLNTGGKCAICGRAFSIMSSVYEQIETYCCKKDICRQRLR